MKGIICLYIYLSFSLPVSAQGVDKSMRVDTLSLAERLSFHTNMVDWTLLTPNVGVEFDVRSTNWNRWAVGMDLRYNWQTKNTFKSGLVYNIMGARLYFRNYWRPRQIGDEGVSRHTRFIDRVFSCRRTRVKHPGLLFYRGAYLSYNKYSIKLLGSEGYQGSAVTAGFTYGIVKPLYVFKNGNSLDFDLGVSAGLAFASYDKYRHDRESDCYPVTKRSQSGVHPVVSDLHVGFVYRLGSYPVTKKYRWRYDCDQVYRDRIDSIYAAKERAAADKRYSDSLTAVVSKDFWHHYDSIMGIKKIETDSLNRVKAAAVAQARQAEKERKRQARLDAKAAKAAAKTRAESTVLTTDSLSSGIVTSDSLSITAPSGEAAVLSGSTAVPSDSSMTAPADITATPTADSSESEPAEDAASEESTPMADAETESTEVAPAPEAGESPATSEGAPSETPLEQTSETNQGKEDAE